jgi:hypothetical protein
VGKAPGLALEMEIERGFGNVESGVDEGRVHGRSRLSLGDASSRLRQRFEFKNLRAGRFTLCDGLLGPRRGNELIPTRCGAALTAPQLEVLRTFPCSAMEHVESQFSDIQGRRGRRGSQREKR